MQKFVKYLAVAVATLIGLGMAGTASANPTILISDANGSLVSYDAGTKASTVISNTGLVLNDIAFNAGGDLYGATDDSFYKISPTTGGTTLLGSLGAYINGLAFGADGNLYATGGSPTGYDQPNLYKINQATGKASLIGATGLNAAGDLAYFKGQMYLASTLGLAVVDTASGVAKLIGGTPDMFGLASTGDALFGVRGTSIYNIDPTTGVGIKVASYNGSGAYGATSMPTSGPVPVPVPEPATWAMMLLGLVLVGYALRRRRAAPHAAVA